MGRAGRVGLVGLVALVGRGEVGPLDQEGHPEPGEPEEPEVAGLEELTEVVDRELELIPTGESPTAPGWRRSTFSMAGNPVPSSRPSITRVSNIQI